VTKDPRFVALKQGFAIKSMLAEPLWSAGQVIGVLSLSASQKRAFASGDQLLARLLANCCTPPIERARLRRLAMTDDLTLAYNQRYLSPRVNEEIERARRSGQPLSVLLLDLDHFKNVNDEHGHEVGDTVLRLFADRVRSIVRRVDVFIRRGGEEFLLLMPATALEQARNTAERIRRNLSDAELDCGGGTRLRQTVSIGAACWDFKESPEALQRRADVAMYAAKEQGRDRVVMSAPPPSLLRVVK
jgi:diguanylate cyclase (GGDEF)-like protein